MSGEVIMPGLADFIERWDEQERAARERLAALAAKPMPEGGTVVYEVVREGTGGDLSDFQAATVSEPHFGYSTPQTGAEPIEVLLERALRSTCGSDLGDALGRASILASVQCTPLQPVADQIMRRIEAERLANGDLIGSWGAWPREDED